MCDKFFYMNEVSNNKPGRKAYQITWPTGEFTTKDIEATLGTSLSKVSIQSRIREAVSSGILVESGSIKSKGRPRICYQLKPATQPVNV